MCARTRCSPVGARDDRPDYDYADGVTLELYALGDGETASCTIFAADAGAPAQATVTVRRKGARLEAESSAPFRWKLLLVGIAEVVDATAPVTVKDRGVLIEGAAKIAATLAREVGPTA